MAVFNAPHIIIPGMRIGLAFLELLAITVDVTQCDVGCRDVRCSPVKDAVIELLAARDPGRGAASGGPRDALPDRFEIQQQRSFVHFKGVQGRMRSHPEPP